MYESLCKLAEKLNIIVGIGGTEPFEIEKDKLKDIPFVNYGVEERLNPSLTMADSKSIIAIGQPYNTVYSKISDDKLRGAMSSGAVGEDYHIVVTKKLNFIVNELLEGYDAMVFADTGPLIDRQVAVRCGLGAEGKHHGIINEKIGSMFFIGYAITNVPLEKWNMPKIKINDVCTKCDKCINACPTGALNKNGFNYKKCISYITQKAGILTNEESKNIGIQIYGCDICQRVCIKNRFNYSENEYAYPDIEELLNISNKEFKSIYGITAAGWRGKKILQRNAIIALGNMRDKRALKLLNKFKGDKREEISHSALWAINEIMKGQ